MSLATGPVPLRGSGQKRLLSATMQRDALICLYGPSGSGKTRLLRTMEKALSEEGALRTGAEEIIWKMADSIRFESMRAFCQRYLMPENLLVDNLWVLDKKPATADEICRILSERQKAGKLTVLASDLSLQQWAARGRAVAQLLSKGRTVQLG